MNKPLSFILLFCVLLAFRVSAQIPEIDSKKIIDTGVQLHDKGEYKKAIEYFTQVPEGDTNYSDAVYELANTQTADSNFLAAKETVIKGLSLHYDNNRRFMLQMANLYDYFQKPDSALYLYDSLTKLNPFNDQPYFEEGVLYFRQLKYDTAITYFQKVLLLNPYHSKAHYLLGLIYIFQGRLTEAYICFQGLLMVCNQKELANKTIGLMADIAKETEAVDKYYKTKNAKYSDALFDETDQIVNAKLALDEQYKPDVPIDDGLLKEMQIIMEKLSYTEKDNNFVMQYYVPLFTKIYTEKMAGAYMLLLLSDYGIQSVDDLAKKKKKEIDEVKNVLYPYLNKIKSTHELNYAKRTNEKDKFLFNGNYMVEGTVRDDDKNKFEEGEVKVYTNYSLVAKGRYNKNSEKEGEWKTWYESGQLKSEISYHNNEETGESKEYNYIGNLKKLTKRDAQGKITEERNYSYKGWLNNVAIYKADGEKELTYYYPNGKKEVTYLSVNDKFKDGKYVSYYDNSNIKKEVSLKDGNESGACKKYYENGVLSEESSYENGKLEGWSTEYYENGKIMNKYFYHDDKAENNYEEYYDNGAMSLSGTFVNDKKNGTEKYYDHTGRVYAIFEYKNHIPVSIKYMDADNKIVYQRANEEGLHKYDVYYPSGVLRVNNNLNENGKRDGKIVFYYASGKISEVDEYKDGKLHGPSVEYYKNGKVRLEENYKDGKRDGYYKNYYPNGKLQSEGWYVGGDKCWLWKYYYVNGALEYEATYVDDQSQGFFKIYNIAGEPESKDMYYYDVEIGTEQYDTSGKIFNKEFYAKGNGRYRNLFENGASNFECNLQYGLFQGPKSKHYYNGTVSEKGYYSFGKRDSIEICYFPDSKKASTGQYHKGLKEGKWTYYNEAGQMTLEDSMQNDEDEGKSKIYACEMLRIMYNYKKGRKHGEQYYYGESGKIAGVLYYYEGDVIGYSYEDKNNKLLPMMAVKNGTAEIKTFYANGNKGLEFNVEESEFNGKQMIYFSNGSVAEERNYSYGNFSGPLKKYHPNGKIIYEGQYIDDKINGEENVYNSNGELIIRNNYYFGYRNGTTEVVDVATHKKHLYQYRYGTLLSIK